MTQRKISRVEVGTYEARVGVRFVYADDTSETHLFNLDLAEQIAAQLAQVCSDLRYIERQIPKDGVNVADHPTVHIRGHEEGHVDG